MRRLFRPRAEPRLVRARVGVFGHFGVSGVVMGAWAGGLPALDERLSLGTGRLGTVLLVLAAGGLVSMLFAGRLCDRFGSRVVTRIGGPVTGATLLGPALAGSYPVLLAATAVFGLAVGILEVSMNVNSVEVESAYGRPIVSAFHGVWSLGGAVGGALIALGLELGLDSPVMLVGAAVIGVIGFGRYGGHLLEPRPAPSPATDRTTASRPARRRWLVVAVLGIAAFAGYISEGAAVDWAAVHARRVLEMPLATAPIAYTVFGIAMTGVRLLGDPIRARLGSARTLLLAGLCAFCGYGLVQLSPLSGGFAVACLGWALTGIGLATVVPVVFSAVGAAGGEVGKALSTVTVFGSAGLLVGPAVIGYLAELTSLPAALVIPTVLTLLVAVLGPAAVRSLGPAPRVGEAVTDPA